MFASENISPEKVFKHAYAGDLEFFKQHMHDSFEHMQHPISRCNLFEAAISGHNVELAKLIADKFPQLLQKKFRGSPFDRCFGLTPISPSIFEYKVSYEMVSYLIEKGFDPSSIDLDKVIIQYPDLKLFNLIKDYINIFDKTPTRFDYLESTLSIAQNYSAWNNDENRERYLKMAEAVKEKMLENPERFAKREFIFSQLHNNFVKNVEAFSAENSISTASLPPLTTTADLYQNNLVIAEYYHTDALPKQFLINNMQNLKEAGYNTIFLEFLYYDADDKSLSDYFNSPGTELPLPLQHRLQDIANNFSCFVKPDLYPIIYQQYVDLLKSAKENGMRVIGLELSEVSTVSGEFSDGKRLPNFNFQATTIIQHEMDKNPSIKWAALTGIAHARRYDNINGVADILAARVLVTHDLEPEEESHLTTNATLMLPALKQRTAQEIACDIYHADLSNNALTIQNVAPNQAVTVSSSGMGMFDEQASQAQRHTPEVSNPDTIGKNQTGPGR